MRDVQQLVGDPERPDPSAVAEYLADIAGELEELAEGAGLAGVAALMRAAVHEAGRARPDPEPPGARPDGREP